MAAGRPCATSSRERATRMLTPIRARVPPRPRPPSLAPQRALQAADLPAQLVSLAALGPALKALRARSQKLLAPLAQQAVSDVVLATKLGHRLGAAQLRLLVDERPILDSEPDKTTARFAGVPLLQIRTEEVSTRSRGPRQQAACRGGAWCAGNARGRRRVAVR